MRAGATALLGLLLVIAGGLFDGEQLYVVGGALVALAGGAWVRVALAARGARVSRALPHRRVVEDEPLEAVIELRAGPLPFPSGELHDPLLPEPASLRGGQQRARVRVRARFGRRGLRELEPPSFELSDALGLSTRVVTARGTDEVLVLPRVDPVRLPGALGGGSGRLGDLLAIGAGIEVDGLRPYREGASAARIHWPTFARGAGLMERRLVADADARPLVVLDAWRPGSEEDLDAAVRATTSIAHELAHAGGCAVLLPGERRPTVLEGLAGWPAVHARLALVPAAGGPRAASFGARKGPVFWCSGRRSATLPPGLADAALGVAVLLVPGALPRRRAILEVGGCRGYAIGGARGQAVRAPAVGRA